jgi:hypothetical protein
MRQFMLFFARDLPVPVNHHEGAASWVDGTPRR